MTSLRWDWRLLKMVAWFNRREASLPSVKWLVTEIGCPWSRSRSCCAPENPTRGVRARTRERSLLSSFGDTYSFSKRVRSIE